MKEFCGIELVVIYFYCCQKVINILNIWLLGDIRSFSKCNSQRWPEDWVYWISRPTEDQWSGLIKVLYIIFNYRSRNDLSVWNLVDDNDCNRCTIVNILWLLISAYISNSLLVLTNVFPILCRWSPISALPIYDKLFLNV